MKLPISLGLTLLLMGEARCADPLDQILVAGSKAFAVKVERFAIRPDEARRLAIAFEKETFDWQSRCELWWCIRNEYVFVRFPEKIGHPLFGVYVDGTTGKCRYVDRDAASRLFKDRFPSGIIYPDDYNEIVRRGAKAVKAVPFR